MAPRPNIVAEELQDRLDQLEGYFRFYDRETSLFFKSEEGSDVTFDSQSLADDIALIAPKNNGATLDYQVYAHKRDTRNKCIGTLRVDAGRGEVNLTYTSTGFPDVPDVFKMTMVSGKRGYEGIASRDAHQWPSARKLECLCFLARQMTASQKE